MPQYISSFPNYSVQTSFTSPYATSYTIPLEQARDFAITSFSETDEAYRGAVRDLRDTVDFLLRRIDDIAKVSTKTESAMRSLKEYLEEYEAATIPAEEVMQFFWKDDDGE